MFRKKRFYDCTLFCDGDKEKLLFSTYRNMTILQILSQKTSLRWVVCELWHFEAILPPRKRFGGVAIPPKRCNLPKPIFGKFLGIWQDFGTTLFSILKKKIFTHPKHIYTVLNDRIVGLTKIATILANKRLDCHREPPFFEQVKTLMAALAQTPGPELTEMINWMIL